jgi:hypothetical protein
MRAFSALRTHSARAEPKEAGSMPSIKVVTDAASGGEAAVFLDERLTTAQLDDAHYAAQLVERLKWAAEEAEHAETERARLRHVEA